MSRMISIILPVKNDPRVFDCLDSLLAQKVQHFGYEIILVENGESNLLPVIEGRYHLHSSKIRGYRLEESGAFRARNFGVRMANAPVCAFIDADCVADEHWLTIGMRHFSSDEKTKIVGGEISMFCAQGCPSAFSRYEQLFYLNQKKYIEEMCFCATANMFVAKEVFSMVGYFNEEKNAEGEREWCIRALKNGCHLIYDNKARVLHPVRSRLDEFTRVTVRNIDAQLHFRNKKYHYLDRLYFDKGRNLLRYLNVIMKDRSLRFASRLQVLLVMGYVIFLNFVVLSWRWIAKLSSD